MLTPKLEEAYNISMDLLFSGVIVVQLMNRKISKQLYSNYLLTTESDPVGIVVDSVARLIFAITLTAFCA